MAYVIAEPCIGTKDTACVDACPVDCIHPKKDEAGHAEAEQLFIDPVESFRSTDRAHPPTVRAFAFCDKFECGFWQAQSEIESRRSPSSTLALVKSAHKRLVLPD